MRMVRESPFLVVLGLSDRLRRLSGSRVGGRVLTVVSGSLAAQILLILASPLLTRLYDPVAFGVFGVITGLATTLGPLAHGGFNQAVVVVRTSGEAANLLALCGLSALSWSLATVAVLAVAGSAVAAAFGIESTGLFWLLPPEMFVLATALTLEFWVLRRRRFRLTAIALGMRSAGQLAVQFATPSLPGGSGLVFGYLAGDLLRAGLLLVPDLRRLGRLRRAVTRRRMLAMARRHWRYPLVTGPAVLLQNATRMLPALALAFFYGPAVAGLYALVQKVVVLPTQLVGNATAKVAVIELTQRPRSRHPASVRRIFFASLLFSGSVFLPLLPFGGGIFALVFGEPWRDAGLYAAWLVPFAVLRFVNVALSQILNLYDRQDLNLVWSLLTFVCSGVVLVAGPFVGWPPVAVIAGLGIVTALVQGLYLAAMLRMIHASA
jgi:O-antigen/teichoic acid export membrane protein